MIGAQGLYYSMSPSKAIGGCNRQEHDCSQNVPKRTENETEYKE